MSDVDVAVAAYPILGLGLCGVLEDRGRTAVAVHSTAELARRLPELRPHVVLVDVVLPGALTAVERSLDQSSAPAVVVMGDEADDDALLVAACAGALGVLPRDVTAEVADRALCAAARGESLLPRRLVPRVMAILRADAVVHHASHGSVLTGKERQVLAMMRAGLSTAAIAERLVVAPVTVRTHVCAIRRKLHLEAGAAVLPLTLPVPRRPEDDLLDVGGHLRIS